MRQLVCMGIPTVGQLTPPFVRGRVSASFNSVTCCGSPSSLQVKDKQIIVPRREKQVCLDFCNYLVEAQVKGLERGMRLGRPLIPEGIPFIMNVDDYSLCQASPNNAGDVSGCKRARGRDGCWMPRGAAHLLPL